MRVSDVYNFIDSFAPFSSQEEWDNSGILTGDQDAEVTRAAVCLDVNTGVLDFASEIGANLIISHHPVIFSPLKSVTADTVVYVAVKRGISIISAHTNLDRAYGGVNDALCEKLHFDYKKAIALNGASDFVNICTPDKVFTPQELCSYLKNELSAAVSYCDAGREIGKIGLCTGAGADFIDDAIRLCCDAFITGEAKYHEFLEAKEKGISLFTVGHFESEIPVVKKLTDALNKEFNCTAFYEASAVNAVITEK